VVGETHDVHVVLLPAGAEAGGEVRTRGVHEFGADDALVAWGRARAGGGSWG
jgi:hypothetical protein